MMASLHKLFIYDVEKAKKIKTFYNNDNEIDNAMFFHSSDAIIYSSNNIIHFWCIYTNEIQKVFKEHTLKINKLDLNIKNDLLVSSNKKELLVWDLETNHQKPIYKIEHDDSIINYMGAFDSSGLVLAINKLISLNDRIFNIVELYNIKLLNQKYFLSFAIENENEMIDMKFSNNLKLMFMIDKQNKIILLDSMTGMIIHIFNKNSTLDITKNFKFSSCFTPDSKFIISGCEDGSIKIYDIKEKQEISKYEGHSKSVKKVVFNPHYLLFVSISKELIIWVPKYTEI